MKPNKPLTNWIVDAVLFLAFVLTFFLDLTGLALHQLLGVFVGALATYHLLVHWSWVKTATKKLLSGTRSRLNYVVDAAVMLGLALIIFTGLAMSTWLNLPLGNYYAWRLLHVWASMVTVALVVVKIGLHWRWIVSVARKHVLPRPDVRPQPAPVAVTLRAEGASRRMDRRAFLVLMGGAGVAGALAIRNARASVLATAPTEEADPEVALPQAEQAEPTSTPTTTVGETAPDGAAAAAPVSVEQAPTATLATATAVPTAVPTVTAVVEDCRVRCPRGCSYPGSCRKYTDANNNGKCDLGECL